eukprot:1158743-Pelagomonas_calceolata.AAC.28
MNACMQDDQQDDACKLISMQDDRLMALCMVHWIRAYASDPQAVCVQMFSNKHCSKHWTTKQQHALHQGWFIRDS